ncbi:MAG: carbohydrate binding family 9 domain-containing protein [Saprospiraceae bacterium]|nr:carbohydrate binding family 9 domain-containing protein [Saprospiraceae bacterium]
MLRLLWFFSLLPHILPGQNAPGSQIDIYRAQGAITVDGILDEPAWTNAQVAKDWYLNYPVDTVRAPFQTEARVTFDDQFFYFSFICYDDASPDFIHSLRRDFEYPLNDNVGINIGPYNDRLNGFFFTLTPEGVQREGIVIGGGAGGDAFNTYWDNKWYSKVVRHKDKWIAEGAIPFKSIRYKGGLDEWNILFDRADRKRNQKSSWIRTPIQYRTGMFAYSGQLIWKDPVPPPGLNMSFIPYLTGSLSRDNEATPTESVSDMQFGFDAKVGLSPSLNLDLAFNPDFSQVEVDEQIINLTRFEFRFPERRQLFLENSDLFNRAGLPEARVFFSRRIGLVRDSSGLFQRIPILYGARLSGSIDRNWRISFLNTQTKKQPSLGLPAQNYTVATIQRNFWAQSSVALTFVNKESLGVSSEDSLTYFHQSLWREIMHNNRSVLRKNTFNRVLGVDLELLSKDTKWHSSFFAAQSFDDFHKRGNLTGGIFFEYTTRNIYIRLRPTYIGEYFNAEAGFVPSYNVYPGQINFKNSINYNFYPSHKSIVSMGPVVEINHSYIPGGSLTDKEYSFGYAFNFVNTATLELTYDYTYQQLTNSFNPIDRRRYTNFSAGEDYDWHTASVVLQTNTRKLINAMLGTTYGGFYNGTNLNINGQINFRYQPYGNISLRFDYNDLRLPNGYGMEKLFLIGPRIDLTFTDKLFLTTYYQYNNLLNNMNLNTRFQWRYKPASDLFIVYTENYLPRGFTSRNRAIVFKFTHWFNL